MQLGEVVGSVVATQKDPRIGNLAMMVVRELTPEGKASGKYIICLDAVGSGPGERVLYVTGSSARLTELTDKKPCDATIMAIVDKWDLQGKIIYDKSKE
jgi:microcompartment protein CcmK/EutM